LKKEAKMETKGKIRKQYKKPQVSQVKLEIGEAVLAACKTASGPGGKNNGCNIGARCKKTTGS